ncbi:MAG: hypothetical protein DWI21_04345 [Planctomycetota bacterium]|nr:MAG: hypothetical protein DWI21_04345 [Planctomycetota bacterium]
MAAHACEFRLELCNDRIRGGIAGRSKVSVRVFQVFRCFRAVLWSLPLWLASNSFAMDLTQDTRLDPDKVYGSLVIKASNITIDGRGAWIVGEKDQPSNKLKGVAILAEGVSNVTLKNVNAKGWETGLRIVGGEGWTIENCNFSDNFHDPEFGWGENGRRGGIVLERVTKSTLRKNKANRVWDACVLVSSNDNRFVENDCTHGGDGIFVRVLNGWRLFEIPLRANDQWQTSGDLPDKVRALALCFDSWGAPILRLTIDGLAFE